MHASNPSAASRSWRARFAAMLPVGSTLPDAAWRARHRLILAILWCHVPAIFALAINRGFSPLHALVEAGAVAAPAAFASIGRRPRRIRALAATLGLLNASGLLVHITGGLTEMHFHFFVSVILVALYEEWAPLMLAVGYVVLHHGTIGLLDPHSVFGTAAAWRRPWVWAGIHGAYITAASGASIVFWRFNESARAAVAQSEVRYREIAETVRVSEERYRTLTSHFPNGSVILFDRDLRYLLVDGAGLADMGLSKAALEGRTIWEAFDEPTAALLEPHYRSALSGTVASFHTVHGGRTYLVRVLPVSEEGGEITRGMVVSQDISERVQVEADFRRLDDTKSAFIADAAHELRTPLTVLTGLVDVLSRSRETLSAEDQAVCFEALDRQGARAVQLVKNLLDLSRLERSAGNDAYPVDVAAHVRSALASAPPGEGRTVEVSIEDGLRAVADPAGLEQILVNLLTNAYKYGGSSVRVASERMGGRVLLAISDNGPGVPEELIPRLFEPFTRGPASAGVHGSGLGMAIVRRLAESYGGEVSYEAGSPSGARFLVSLVPAA